MVHGFRTSIFFQGCSVHCKACFNQHTWSFDGGREFTEADMQKILDSMKPYWVEGFSVLGGEPLDQPDFLLDVTSCIKEHYPYKSIWVWTGHNLSDLDAHQMKSLRYTDILVEGPFIEELKDLSLKWRGSINQRILERQPLGFFIDVTDIFV